MKIWAVNWSPKEIFRLWFSCFREFVLIFFYHCGASYKHSILVPTTKTVFFTVFVAPIIIVLYQIMERKLNKENWLGSWWPAFSMLSLSMANKMIKSTFSSVQFSCSAMSDSLWPHGLQHTRPLCHHQLPEFTQTHVHLLGDAIQHLILCRPLILFPSISPTIRVFSNESLLCIRWPK